MPLYLAGRNGLAGEKCDRTCRARLFSLTSDTNAPAIEKDTKPGSENASSTFPFRSRLADITRRGGNDENKGKVVALRGQVWLPLKPVRGRIFWALKVRGSIKLRSSAPFRNMQIGSGSVVIYTRVPRGGSVYPPPTPSRTAAWQRRIRGTELSVAISRLLFIPLLFDA